MGFPVSSDTRSDNPTLCPPKSGGLPWTALLLQQPSGLAHVSFPCRAPRCSVQWGTRRKGGRAGGTLPGSRILPRAERRGRISSHVSAMLILFIHRQVMLHPPGVTLLIHVLLVNRPNPLIRSSARVWREKRMGPVRAAAGWVCWGGAQHPLGEWPCQGERHWHLRAGCPRGPISAVGSFPWGD